MACVNSWSTSTAATARADRSLTVVSCDWLASWRWRNVYSLHRSHYYSSCVVLGHSHKTPRAWSQMLVGYTTHSVSIRGHAATSYYRRAGGFTVLHRAALRGTCKHVITSVRLIVTQETQLSRRGRSRPMSLEILLK